MMNANMRSVSVSMMSDVHCGGKKQEITLNHSDRVKNGCEDKPVEPSHVKSTFSSASQSHKEFYTRCGFHKKQCRIDCVEKVRLETLKEVLEVIQTEVYEDNFDSDPQGITFWTMIERELKELSKK